MFSCCNSDKSDDEDEDQKKPQKPKLKQADPVDLKNSSSSYSGADSRKESFPTMGSSPRYRLSSDIYTSNYTMVKRGHTVDGKQVAVKIYKLQPKNVTLSSIQEISKVKKIAFNESHILATIPYHPNIIKYYNSEDFGSEFHICVEYCPKSLFDLIERKPLHLKTCVDLFHQLCLGLRHLHELKLAHRDIKPENLLITYINEGKEAQLKITDFGFATYFTEDEKLTVYCGTMLYAAPELLHSIPYDGRGVDIWAALVTLHAMGSSRSLFGGVDNVEIVARILERPIRFSSLLPPEITEFLKFGLKREPSDRPTIEGLLNHPFFDDYRWRDFETLQKSKSSTLSLKKKASGSVIMRRVA
jgi:serine/threonine protein kinase